MSALHLGGAETLKVTVEEEEVARDERVVVAMLASDIHALVANDLKLLPCGV